MRKLSIVLLVGLMLIGGLSVGVYAQTPPDATNGSTAENTTDATPSSSDPSPAANTYASAQINTIAAIYVHKTVDLGTLSATEYTIGSGYDTDVLKSTGNTIKAYANDNYEVTVSASQVSSNNNDRDFDMSRFKFKGGSENVSWKAFDQGSGGTSIKLIDKSSGGLTNTSVGYKYEPNETDKPGNYKAQLQYTVSIQ